MPPPTVAPMLNVRGHMLLAHAELTGSHLHRAGLIRRDLGCSEWLYAAELDALIDTQAAQAEYPALCRRLRALREKRAAWRSMRARNTNERMRSA